MPFMELLSDEGVLGLMILVVFCLIIIAAGVIHVVFRGGSFFVHSVRESYARREAESKMKEVKGAREVKEEELDWHSGVDVIHPIGLDPIYLYEEGEWVVSDHLRVNIKLDEAKNLYISEVFASMENIEETNVLNVFKVRAANGEKINLAIRHLNEQILNNIFFEKDISQLSDFEKELNHYNVYKNCIKKVENKYWFVLLNVDGNPPINTLTEGLV